MTALINMNIVQTAYASSKEFIQNHKYQLAAVATATSAVAVAALALYSGRISLPQSSEGKAFFILVSTLVSSGTGAVAGAAYCASGTNTTNNSVATIMVEGMFRIIGGAFLGGSAGATIGSVGASILLNR